MKKPYDPIVLLNKAVKAKNKGVFLFNNGNYQLASNFFKESIEILKTFLEDSKDPNNFILEDFSFKHIPEEILKLQSTNCINDLGVIYQSLAKCYFFLDEYNKCTKYLKTYLDYSKQYNKIVKTEESYNKLVEAYFILYLFSSKMDNRKDEFEYLVKFVKSDIKVICKYKNIDFNTVEKLSLSFDDLGLFMRNDPDKVKTVITLFVDSINSLSENECYEVYLAFQSFATTTLEYYLDNDKEWYIDGENFEIILIAYLRNCFDIFSTYGIDDLTVMVDYLKDISGKLKTSTSIGLMSNLISQFAMTNFETNNYPQAAENLEFALNLMEKCPDSFDDYQRLIRYEKLIPALSADYDIEKLNYYFNKTLELLDTMVWKSIYQRHGFNEDTFRKEINTKRIELYFNRGVSAFYNGNAEDTEKYFKIVKDLIDDFDTDEINERNIKDLLQKITMIESELSGDNSVIDTDLSKELEQVKTNIDTIDRLLNKVFGEDLDLDSEEARETGKQVLSLLLESEKSSFFRHILTPNSLLKFYYFTHFLISFDSELEKSLLENIPSLIEYLDSYTFPEHLAMLLANLAQVKKDENSKEYIKQAIDILENIEVTENFDPLTKLPTLYYDYAVAHVKEAEFKTVIEYAERARDLWEILQFKTKENFSKEIKTCNTIIQWCKEIMSK